MDFNRLDGWAMFKIFFEIFVMFEYRCMLHICRSGEQRVRTNGMGIGRRIHFLLFGQDGDIVPETERNE